MRYLYIVLLMMKEIKRTLKAAYLCVSVPCIYIVLLYSCAQPAGSDLPVVVDNALQIELISENPDIVTPIGITIDSKDQIYVLESHTHQPPKEYTGPAYDQIKKGIDADQDGIPESWIIFADSIMDGMNLACDEKDIIYLTEKDHVWSFEDVDGDGISDRRSLLLTMDPPDNVYDHAGMLGLTLNDDWLYVSRGNTGSQSWRITGTDGSQLSGYGDGGNVMRCRTDGSELEEIATGFWNPFDITFTREGRLMLVDNDPDSRGPNRLVEVVPEGHYGYESLYGGSGLHPFLAWNGELPGTLPYAAALGEAPSGLLDASFTQFPSQYQDNILCTIWEENSIVRVPLQPDQSTVKGQSEILVQGNTRFHPVAMATNSKGEVYLTDWVVRQYPNHGKGKIWRLSSRATSRNIVYQAKNDPDRAKDNHVFASRYREWENEAELLQALQSGDPFIQTSARNMLISPEYQPFLLPLLEHEHQILRLQALIALMNTSIAPSSRLLQSLVRDNSDDVKKMALIYIAKYGRDDLLPSVQSALEEGYITENLLTTWLATLRHLQPDFIKAKINKSEQKANALTRKLPDGYVWELIQNKSIPENLRAMILPFLEDPETYSSELQELYLNSSPEMKMALLRLFQRIPDEDLAKEILTTIKDQALDISLRVQALVTLSYQRGTYCDEMRNLADSDNDLFRNTAQRYLERCGEVLSSIPPKSDDEWIAAVNEEGNAQNGRLIFQFSSTQCQNCHQVNGWGGQFGPDLSHVGSSKTREQLIRAILQPSAEISPEWQGWYVTDKEGVTHYGRQIDVGANTTELMLSSGEFMKYPQPLDFGLAPASLMPEGLESTLTLSEFNDLIAYLVSLK